MKLVQWMCVIACCALCTTTKAQTTCVVTNAQQLREVLDCIDSGNCSTCQTCPTLHGVREHALLAEPFLPEELVADKHAKSCAIDKIAVEDVVAAAESLAGGNPHP